MGLTWEVRHRDSGADLAVAGPSHAGQTDLEVLMCYGDKGGRILAVCNCWMKSVTLTQRNVIIFGSPNTTQQLIAYTRPRTLELEKPKVRSFSNWFPRVLRSHTDSFGTVFGLRGRLGKWGLCPSLFFNQCFILFTEVLCEILIGIRVLG